MISILQCISHSLGEATSVSLGKVSPFRTWIFTALVVVAFPVWCQIEPESPLFIFSEAGGNKTQQLYKENKSTIPFVYLLGRADALVEVPLMSVRLNQYKSPKGSNADYFSIGPYWWPDTSKPDGLPWIRKDGVINEAVRADYSDSKLFAHLVKRIHTLALSFHLTGNGKYATRIEALIRAWFLDSDTAMNPNFNFAQAIPGVVEGRGIGIIEFRHIVYLLDAVALVQHKMTKKTKVDFNQWLSDMLAWLLSSQHGKDEAKKENNHGTFYDAIVTRMALHLGDIKLAERWIEVTAQRALTQIADNGTQELELARTRPFHYSLFNLHAFLLQYTLSLNTNTPMHVQYPRSAKRIESALTYMLTHHKSSDYWPGSQESVLAYEHLVTLAVIALRFPNMSQRLIVPDSLVALTAETRLQWESCHLWLLGKSAGLMNAMKSASCDVIH